MDIESAFFATSCIDHIFNAVNVARVTITVVQNLRHQLSLDAEVWLIHVGSFLIRQRIAISGFCFHTRCVRMAQVRFLNVLQKRNRRQARRYGLSKLFSS